MKRRAAVPVVIECHRVPLWTRIGRALAWLWRK